MTQVKHKLRFLIASLLLAIIAVVFLPATSHNVFADTEPVKHTVTFTYNGQTLRTRQVEDGGNIKKSDFPLSELPEIGENDMWVWMYTSGENLISISYSAFNGEDDRVLVSNITQDINLYPTVFKNPDKTHKVIFRLPDKTEVILTVYNGEDCPEPDIPLGFCERASYSSSLKNIREDMTIDVTIDRTMKYIFLIGCGTALLASIVVIVVVILKVVNAPEDDDDENEEEIVNSTNSSNNE